MKRALPTRSLLVFIVCLFFILLVVPVKQPLVSNGKVEHGPNQRPSKPKRVVDVEPVRLSRTGSTRMRDRVDCDIPCWMDKVWDYDVHGKLVAIDLPPPNEIFFTVEGPQLYARPPRTSKTLGTADYTFSSDVHATYWRIDPAHRGRWTYLGRSHERMANLYDAKPVNFATARKKLLWVASMCKSKNNREKLVRDLQKEALLDSAGKCVHNYDAPHVKGLRGGIDKAAEMRKYLFYAAFENQASPDYVTEKLFHALDAGTIPVVFGAPNIHQLVPKEWYITVSDFKSTQELAKYLRLVAHNETLFMRYHHARMSPWPKWFVDKWSYTYMAECRVCKLVAAAREPHKYIFNRTSQNLEVRN